MEVVAIARVPEGGGALATAVATSARTTTPSSDGEQKRERGIISFSLRPSGVTMRHVYDPRVSLDIYSQAVGPCCAFRSPLGRACLPHQHACHPSSPSCLQPTCIPC